MRCVNKAAIGKHAPLQADSQSVFRRVVVNGVVVGGQGGIICLVNGGDDTVKEVRGYAAFISP